MRKMNYYEILENITENENFNKRLIDKIHTIREYKSSEIEYEIMNLFRMYSNKMILLTGNNREVADKKSIELDKELFNLHSLYEIDDKISEKRYKISKLNLN